MLKKTLFTTATAAAVLSFVGAAQAADAPEKEKCYGVVKAGKNDCGSPAGGHSCAGQAKADASANEWVFVPKGLCERLTNGALAAKDAEKKG